MSKPYNKSGGSGIRFQWLNWDQTNPGGSFGNSAVSWTDSANGVSNPFWKSQIASNEGATTPFNSVLTTCEHVDGHLEFRGYVTALGDNPASFRMSGKRGALYVPDYHASVPGGSSSVTKAVSMASSKFYNKSAGIIKALEGGELIGETHKTAKAIIGKTNQMVGLLTQWKGRWNSFRSSFHGFASDSKRQSARRKRLDRFSNREATFRKVMAFASDNYLEWKFGVDPLVKDVHALSQDLKEDFTEVETFKSNGSATEQGPNMSSISFGPLGGLVSASANTISIQTCQVQYKAAIVLRRYGVGGLAERLGLSPSNFLPTYYNLLPWSWLLDYVTNVGDIVQAIAFDPARIAWCNTTVRKILVTTTLSGVNPVVNAGLTAHAGYPIASPSRTVWTTKLVNRNAQLPERIPELRFRLPDFQTEGGRSRWLNVAAVLASQAFGKSMLSSLGVTGAPE